MLSEDMGFFHIMGEAWKHFWAKYYLIIPITLLFCIPINIAMNMITFGEGWDGFVNYMRAVQIAGLISILAWMAIIHIVKCSIDGTPVDFGGALAKAFSKWGVMFGTNLLQGFYTIGLVLLLIIPGIIYYVYWIFSQYVVVIVGKSGKDAMDYSKALVKGRWWRVFGMSLGYWALGFVIMSIATVRFLFLPETLLLNVMQDTIFDVMSSYFIAVTTLFFLNLDLTRQRSSSLPITPQNEKPAALPA